MKLNDWLSDHWVTDLICDNKNHISNVFHGCFGIPLIWHIWKSLIHSLKKRIYGWNWQGLIKLRIEFLPILKQNLNDYFHHLISPSPKPTAVICLRQSNTFRHRMVNQDIFINSVLHAWKAVQYDHWKPSHKRKYTLTYSMRKLIGSIWINKQTKKQHAHTHTHTRSLNYFVLNSLQRKYINT